MEHGFVEGTAHRREADASATGGDVEFDNITERKRAEQALRESDRRKSKFLAMLSHELRNPLAPLRNALWILENAERGEQVAAARVTMNRQVTHLTRIVDDLLDVTRLGRGKRTPLALTAQR
jgi:signal transduction histidine kinase